MSATHWHITTVGADLIGMPPGSTPDTEAIAEEHPVTAVIPTRHSAEARYYLDGLHNRHHAEARAVASLLPNCFIIGAAKSGTTTVASTLRRHREVYVSRPKEPKFFGPEYPRGWAWYATHFAGSEAAKIRIDASTMYSSAEPLYLGTPQLISNYLPDAKIIYIVRHPLERIVSHWRHWKGRKPEMFGAFHEVLDRPRDRRLFVETSLYAERLSGYLRHFKRENILLLTFEDMVGTPVDFLGRVLGFLQVRQGPKVTMAMLPEGVFRQLNPAGSNRELVPRPDWDPSVKARVSELIAPDARRFLREAGKPEDFWQGL
jgi:hypothetical protein